MYDKISYRQQFPGDDMDEVDQTRRIKEMKSCDCEEKFEEQRKINLEMMKKINLIANNHQCLMKLIAEQTQNLKTIVEGFIRMSKENDEVKINMRELTEQVIELEILLEGLSPK